ncbi:MAG: rRNA maturation RNase YbeY, partial [Clostridia bacterium]|nr:rRNA maturation RNase YbeY [Clostridia bacterium]
IFMGEKDMRGLNKRTRDIDRVTDVLSYPNFTLAPYETLNVDENAQNGEVLLGDMAICLKQAKRQAKEYKVTVSQEVIKLVIHSTLHLMGFDHIKDEDYEVMQKEEDRLASKFYTNEKF